MSFSQLASSLTRDDWTTPSGPGAQVSCINAASFNAAVAPGSIAAVFGTNLTTTSGQASLQPLPTVLMGARVSISGVAAQLLYVSPTQINLVIPDGLPSGRAPVVITGSDGRVTAGSITVQPVAPGVFSTNANGSGIAAALTTYDGVYYQPAINPDATPRPLSVGTAEQPDYLVLFATGVRGRGRMQDVVVLINGIYCQPTYAGPQPAYAGLDQINLPLPQALRNAGEVEVQVIINGVSGNRTRLVFGS